MKIKIGQIDIEFSSQHLTVKIPSQDHEININVVYIPSSTTPLDVQLKIAKVFKD